MNEPFPKNVQDSIFRLCDIIAAFYEDIVATDEGGFYGLVGEKRKQDAKLLIEYEIFRFSHDNFDKCAHCENIHSWYSLGRRGLDAYEMICKDPEKCNKYSTAYIEEILKDKGKS